MTKKYVDSDNFTFEFDENGRLISNTSDTSPYLERDFLADEISVKLLELLYSSKIKQLSLKEMKSLYYLLLSANEIINEK